MAPTHLSVAVRWSHIQRGNHKRQKKNGAVHEDTDDVIRKGAADGLADLEGVAKAKQRALLVVFFGGKENR